MNHVIAQQKEEIFRSWTAEERDRRKRLAASKQLQLRQLVFLAAVSGADADSEQLEVSSAC